MTTTAEQARNEAIDRVRQHAPADWMADAASCARALAVTQPTFSTDDVWQIIGQPPEPRAMGAVMKNLRGWIEPTGEYVPSIRPKCHARPVRVWRLKRRADPDNVRAAMPNPGAILDALRAKYAA